MEKTAFPTYPIVPGPTGRLCMRPRFPVYVTRCIQVVVPEDMNYRMTSQETRPSIFTVLFPFHACHLPGTHKPFMSTSVEEVTEILNKDWGPPVTRDSEIKFHLRGVARSPLYNDEWTETFWLTVTPKSLPRASHQESHGNNLNNVHVYTDNHPPPCMVFMT